jgi:hypothetical protein
VVCTDSQSVLTFLEELSGLISLTLDQLLKNNSDLKVDPFWDVKSSKKSPCIRFKLSTKYPIEGFDAYAHLIEKINSKLLKSNFDGVDKILMCNKENDKNQSNYGDSQARGVEEVTILNPTWVFDSISDYSIMSTA